MRLALLMAAVVAAALLAPGSAPAQARSAADTAVSTQQSIAQRPVLGSEFGDARSWVYGTYGRSGTVRGWFTPRRFENRAGKLVAIGRLHAVLRNGDGELRGEENRRIAIPVKRIEGDRVGARQLPSSCQILNLVLGPLDLNLLGLEVHLNRIVLNIVATPGPGNLLGNLLCAIAGLLDNVGVLRQIRQILNAILAILRLPA
ncbi:hypothetical protein [Nocardioides bizhenqiangii]|uniref:ABC transporter substrate-binding protein n=1 Tax=Nocardioides bizhenqiangii TaxID=3095076 RepID=A0ABZ0ZQU9_9ACTN|nr:MULTISPECIES: hypothetical protein [unclassified Nocardioides]MDZ5619296.1 hypothetical protein [Nocardioides sp. HM23]WQQ26681.1 hypothetical protein SHK19_00270 [Nocardioides sp. HM61]